MEIISSALWVGGIVTAAGIAGELSSSHLNLFLVGMPKTTKDFALLGGGMALGYYWYGPIGAVGGAIGVYGSFWAYVVVASLISPQGAFN
jgi:hypothetical protein